MGHAAALPCHAHAAAGRPHQCDAVWCLLSHCKGRVARKAVLTQGTQLPKLREAHRHAAPAGTQQDSAAVQQTAPGSSRSMEAHLLCCQATSLVGTLVPACWAPQSPAQPPGPFSGHCFFSAAAHLMALGGLNTASLLQNRMSCTGCDTECELPSDK